MKIALDIGSTYYGGGHPLDNITGVGRLVGAITSNMLVIAGVIFVFTIVYGGIAMIGAAGDPQQYARAQTILTTGVVGIVIVALAWFITFAVQRMFGITIL